jgi:glycosyltransferase involved in cell wall biosynthesis
MRVYHLSSAPYTGGAARAALRLHQGLLREASVESTWLNAGGGATGPNVEILPSPCKRAPLTKRMRRRYWANTVSRDFTPTTPPASNPVGWGSIEMLEKLPAPDVWNLHWVSWFLDWETMLPWMAERAPIVWTLHDLNPLSGIWHYEPLAEERTQRRMSLETRASELKRRALAKIPRDRLTFVGPSRWMVECCRTRAITREFPVKHIPYGLDTEAFAPRDRAAVRKMFSIPEDTFVIGFIADNLADPRKGVECLRDAMCQMAHDHPHIHLLTVGNGQVDGFAFHHTSLGAVHNDQLLSYFYSTCDVFVCPSLQDNLPNTVLEAMACGAPTVGFNIGGLKDMVEHLKTGCLAAKPGDPAALRSSIQMLLEMDKLSLSQVKNECRRMSLERYSLTRQSENYMNLYREIHA